MFVNRYSILRRKAVMGNAKLKIKNGVPSPCNTTLFFSLLSIKTCGKLLLDKNFNILVNQFKLPHIVSDIFNEGYFQLLVDYL